MRMSRSPTSVHNYSGSNVHEQINENIMLFTQWYTMQQYNRINYKNMKNLITSNSSEREQVKHMYIYIFIKFWNSKINMHGDRNKNVFLQSVKFPSPKGTWENLRCLKCVLIGMAKTWIYTFTKTHQILQWMNRCIHVMYTEDQGCSS